MGLLEFAWGNSALYRVVSESPAGELRLLPLEQVDTQDSKPTRVTFFASTLKYNLENLRGVCFKHVHNFSSENFYYGPFNVFVI